MELTVKGGRKSAQSEINRVNFEKAFEELLDLARHMQAGWKVDDYLDDAHKNNTELNKLRSRDS